MRVSLALAALIAVTLGSAPSQAGFSEFFVPPSSLAGGWEIVSEMPVTVTDDPDLVRWGVQESETRHYTRHRDRRVEVCSVEIWAFSSGAQARNASEDFEYPNWAIEREGSHLVMLRGRRWDRGDAPRAGVFPACAEIGRRIRMRVSQFGGE